MNIEKERLQNAPDFDTDNWPDMADPSWGSQLHSHYGYKPYWDDEDSELPSAPRRQE